MVKLSKINPAPNAQPGQPARQPIINPALVRVAFGLGLLALSLTPVLSDPGSPW